MLTSGTDEHLGQREPNGTPQSVWKTICSFLKRKNQRTPTSQYVPEEMLTLLSVYLRKVQVPDDTTAPYTCPQFDCEQPTWKPAQMPILR